MSKRTVRRGVFETNSSSVHSITICTSEDYKGWESGELVYNNDGQLITTEEAKEMYKNDKYRDKSETFEKWFERQTKNDWLQTYEEYYRDDYYEHFYEEFTTPSGDKMVAFGHHGYNG